MSIINLTNGLKSEIDNFMAKGLNDAEARARIKSLRTQDRINKQIRTQVYRNQNQNSNENGGTN